MTGARGGAADPLASAAQHGIHRLAVPTPFAVGRVNCYLIEDSPLTLVDTGPNSGKSLDELERALAVRGRRVEDLELIVLTHQHTDHEGLTEILVRRSGAAVAALDRLAPYLANFAASAAADDELAHRVMRRHGVDEDLAIALQAFGAMFRAFGSSALVTHELRAGGELVLRDRRLEILHRPGHSPSDTLLWDPDRRILLAGDHLLAHISSNPLISRPLPRADGALASASEEARCRSLLDYIASMRKTRELPAELVLSGHGSPITDHVRLIDERLRMHERRARKILTLLKDGPLSAFELARRMWGELALTQTYLTLSEVIGHLDLLVAQGCVEKLQREGVVRFSPTGTPTSLPPPG